MAFEKKCVDHERFPISQDDTCCNKCITINFRNASGPAKQVSKPDLPERVGIYSRLWLIQPRWNQPILDVINSGCNNRFS